MGTIDLMECISNLPITIISRDICARPNTFALETIRPGKAGETETLVLKRSIDRKNTMVERHMLSADTKEVWMTMDVVMVVVVVVSAGGVVVFVVVVVSGGGGGVLLLYVHNCSHAQ